MKKPMITGRSYQQARIYALSRGYPSFDFIGQACQLRGLRPFKLKLEALPGSDEMVLSMATAERIEVLHVRV